jgi:pimeloyl-ACP methyl ester carboxylesterase
VRAGDVDVYIQEEGPKSGPAVVLLHAAGGWSGVWKQTMDALADAGCHAIALDMPPLGFSEKPATPRYSREDQAKRLIGALDALNIEKATLVGHSFGARAVAQAALEHPERVGRLVFASAAINFGTPAPSLKGNIIGTLLSIQPLRRAFTAATLTNPSFTRKLLQMFVYKPESATDDWVGVYQAFLKVEGSTNGVADWLPELINERDTSKSSDEKAYAAIHVPTLVLWGDKDSVTPLSDGEHLAKLIPEAELEVLPGVGHLPPIENTAGFNKALLKFLATH